MNKYKFICFFLFSTHISLGQIVFHKMYPGLLGESMFRDMGFIQTSDNGYFLGNGGTLMKLDSVGAKEWRLDFNYSPIEWISVFSIVKDYNEGYSLSGYGKLLSLDSSLNTNWMKDIVSNYEFYIITSKKIDSINFIFSGVALQGNFFGASAFKTDSSGTIIWTKLFNSIPKLEKVSSMANSIDGGVIMCGASLSIINPGAYESVIFKIDSDGNVQWSKRYANVGVGSDAISIKPTNDGNFIITGRRNSHRYLMKLNNSGNIVWNKLYSVGLAGNSLDVICAQDGGFAFVGEVADTITGGTAQTSFFIKTDSLGNIEWSKYMGGFGSVSASKLIQTNDNGYAIAGRRFNAAGDFVLNLIKTDSLGNTGGCLEQNILVTVTNLNDTLIDFILTDSSIAATTVPFTHTFPLIGSEIDLCNFQGVPEQESGFKFEVYPNPNLGNFEIELQNPSTFNSFLSIYNLVGELVYENELKAGEKHHEIIFKPQSSGLFIVKIQISSKLYYSKVFVESE